MSYCIFVQDVSSFRMTCLAIFKRTVAARVKSFILWIPALILRNRLNPKCYLHLRDSSTQEMIRFKTKGSFCHLCTYQVKCIYEHLRRGSVNRLLLNRLHQHPGGYPAASPISAGALFSFFLYNYHYVSLTNIMVYINYTSIK